MDSSRAITARRSSRLLLLASVVLAFSGCRANQREQVQTELFQRELRLQEDEIYRLEDYLEEYQGIVRGYRCKIEELEEELEQAQSVATPAPAALSADAPDGPRIAPAPEPEPIDEPSPVVDPDALIEMPEELAAPESPLTAPETATQPADSPLGEAPLAEPSAGALPEPLPASNTDTPPPFVPPGEEAPPFDPGASATPTVGTSRVVEAAAETSKPSQSKVVRAVELPAPVPNEPPNPFPHTAEATLRPVPLPTKEPLRSGKRNAPAKLSFDDRVTTPREDTNQNVAVRPRGVTLQVRSGVEGELIAVVSEAQQASLAGFQGEASILLTDPSLPGRAGRLARWDFDTEEVAAARGLGKPGEGIQIGLPLQLPIEPPTARPLRVWVRLVSRRGEKQLAPADVAFVGSPPRLKSIEPLADLAAPRRLPSSDTDRWRPARRDNRIQTATFLSP